MNWKGKEGTTMIKKVVLGTLLIGLIGILVAGAVIRTVDKTEQVAEGRGQGRGQGGGQVGEYVQVRQGQGRGANAQGGGYGRSGATVEQQYLNYEAPIGDLDTYEGTVVEAAESGGDLVILTDEGQEITVGTGPGYMETQGFTLQAGEQVQVEGYWENDELKAAQVTRLRDGQTIVLRDQFGRPAWSGGGWRATEQQAAATGGGRGYGGQGRNNALGDATGTGQAQVDTWLTLQGTVVSIDSNALVVEAEGGEQVVVENRPWWFAQEQGFVAQTGDELVVVGFYEGDEFEVGRLDNLATGLSVPIRGENGRPLWAGGRGRGS
jgi:hypothetical protein